MCLGLIITTSWVSFSSCLISCCGTSAVYNETWIFYSLNVFSFILSMFIFTLPKSNFLSVMFSLCTLKLFCRFKVVPAEWSCVS